MTKLKILMTAVLCATASLGLADSLFFENFRNYNQVAPGINPSVNPYVDNDPIWARSANLMIKPADGESGDVFLSEIPLPKGNKFDVHFKFRLLNSESGNGDTPKKSAFFHLSLISKDGQKQRILIAADKIGETDTRFLPNWHWAYFAIKANGKTADLYHAPDREMLKLATIPLLREVAGVNITASADNHFAFTDFVVSDPAELPSHPVEKHFADFRSLRQPIAGAITAKSGGETLTLTPNPMAGVRFVLSSEHPAEMTMRLSGRETTHKIHIRNQRHRTRQNLLGIPKGAETNLTDATIDISGICSLSVRPDLKMYCSSYDMEPQGVDIIRDWERLPKASEHPLDIDFVRDGQNAINLYIDGSYIKSFAVNDAAKACEITFNFPEGTRYLKKNDIASGLDRSRFTLIDMAANPRAKAFVGATSTVKPGLRNFNGIPIEIVAPINSADVAICKQGKGNWALEVEEYHGRSPLHGFPSAIHYRLPAALYGKAHIVFALDPDTKKDKILTLRLGHYINNGSGGNMLGDTVINLEDGVPQNFDKIGELVRDGKTIPLYKATFALNPGDIVDVKDYIDFELVGKGWQNFEQINRTIKPDPDSDSAFNIFGITLEKVPLEIDFKQHQPGNIFTLNEQDRKTSVILTAMRDGVQGKISWKAHRTDGETLFDGATDFSFARAGVSNVFDIALTSAKIVGHYTLEITVTDKVSGCAITHNAAFAIMPEAGRNVSKWDSPYAVWWFSVHGSPGNAEIGGPIMQKAGIVRASANNSLTAEDYEKYNITPFRNAYIKVSLDRKTGDFEKRSVVSPTETGPDGKPLKILMSSDQIAEDELRRTLLKDKTIDTVMLWHETAPGYGIPEELLGKPIPKDAAKNDKNLAKIVNACGKIVRKLNKELGRDVKLQIGNSSASIGAAVRPLRSGANPDYYDQIGIETASQVIPPERLSEVGLQGMLIAQDIASLYAKRKVKLNGCWEFTYRCERDMGERQQAEWYVRDILISLANDFYYISPGILFDCNNGYYNGLWGASGLIRRAPFCYPKQAYVAYGVLTSVLDGVKFSRQLDTGSTTVYALEFKRIDGKYAYALWAARGEAEFLVESKSGGQATYMMGETMQFGSGSAKVSGGTSPTYLVTDSPISKISISLRTFQKDASIAERLEVATHLDNVEELFLEPDKSFTTDNTHSLPIMRFSDFTISQVTDETRGNCLEVSLDLAKNTDTSKYITEYTTVRLREPKPLPGKPSVIGVWVKGNSNWGQIRFEIEDAKGEVFKNETTGPSWGCNIMDWPGNLAVNFDGWNFVYTSLFENTIMNDHSPGPASEQWVSEGGDKIIDLPIKLRAITVGMNRTKLDLLDFKASSPAIRLSSVGGIGK